MFAKAISINPKDDKIYSYGLGYLYRDEGKLDEALKMFKKAVEINPSSFNYMGLGDIYRHLARYEDSEKYEIKWRDWNAAGNIKEFIRQINLIRKENPALREPGGLHFLNCTNDQILVYSKRAADQNNTIIVAVNLDPHATQSGEVSIDPAALGLASQPEFNVRDLLTDARYRWSQKNFLSLNPTQQPAHIFLVEP